MQELYTLAEALKPFHLSPAEVAEVGVGRSLDAVHVMTLVTLVCGGGVGQAKAVAIEAEHGIILSEYQENLLRDLLDDTGDEAANEVE